MVSKWNDNTNDWSYVLEDFNESDKLIVALSESTFSDLAVLEENTSIPLGIWVHVAITYDTTDGTLRLYFNGVEDASLEVGPGRLIDASLTDLLIGAIFTGGGILQHFDGLIDELAMVEPAMMSSSGTTATTPCKVTKATTSCLAARAMTP